MKKKLLAILLAGALSASFIACGNGNKDTDTKPETSESSTESTTDEDSELTENESQPEESPETIYETGNSASLKDWTINLTDAQIVDSIAADYGSFEPKEEGNKIGRAHV